MGVESRTKKSIRNSGVALTTYFINLILQFYSRKIFLYYLGTEVLGLNSTASNLLQFINLAELGIGTAIACTLYKPLAEENKEVINDIITLQSKLYKFIAIVVLMGGIMISLFFPVIFKKMTLPLWYAYASFGVLMFSSLLGYFVNYKQILLTASQQDYKIQYTYKLSSILKVTCQMIAMMVMPHPYLIWISLEIIFTIIASCSLHYTIKNSFPSLKKSELPFGLLRKRYKEVINKVKQVFVHRISAFALFQLSPLIVFFYENLNLVTLYTNYLMVITGISALIAAVFNSIVAGIGNLLSQSPGRALVFYKELFSLRFWVTSLSCFLFYLFVDNFIRLWLGAEFILPHSTVILLTINLFIGLVRQVNDNFLSAYGLFSDTWAPITEMILCLVGSIIIGYFWGLNGVILGGIISQTLIIIIWKPVYLFVEGLKKSVWIYWFQFFKHFILSLCTAIICYFIIKMIHLECDGYINMLILLMISALLFGGGLVIIMNITKCDIINFEKRLLDVIFSVRKDRDTL